MNAHDRGSGACACCSEVLTFLGSGFSRTSFLGGAAAVTASGALTPLAAASQTAAPSATAAAGPAAPAPAPQTIVYVAQSVVTMESPEPANAVAVAGGRFVGVGMLDALTASLPPGSFTIDRRFAPNVMLPGLIEQHLHPLLGAASLSAVIIAIEDWNVPGNISKAALDHTAYVERLRAAVAGMGSAPPDEMLFTWGYHQYFHGNVYRPQLDAISPNRPVVTWHRSCHELILNSAALKKYNITAASLEGHGPASAQASFQNGHFYEKGLTLVPPALAKEIASPERLRIGTERLKTFLRSKGITTICEPGTQMSRPIQNYWEASLGGDDTGFRTYFIADGRALYDQHVKTNALTELVTDTAAFAAWGKGNVQWLPHQVKLFSDGAIFSQLMQVEQPYLDGHRGEWIAEPKDYSTAFKLYWDAGYHIHTHVNGDAGLKLVVDTLAANMKAHPRSDHRFTVVHFAVSQDAQVAELAGLGAIISANPYYVTSLADRYSQFGLGPERADSMVRLGTAVKHKVSISLHSDMPMAPAEPLFLMWCAVNRTTVSGRVAGASQRITAYEALRAVTIDAAYSLELERELGSIKAGKRADLTVVDASPLDVEPAKIKDIRIVGTIFEGQLVPAATNVTPQTPEPAGGPLSSDTLNSTVG